MPEMCPLYIEQWNRTSSHRLFTCHSQTLSDTESHSIPLLCISSSDISLLLSPIQPGSIRQCHQVRNNPLDRLLAHEFPCGKASLLCLALAVTRLQVATPFPPCARTNYVGVVARSPQSQRSATWPRLSSKSVMVFLSPAT